VSARRSGADMLASCCPWCPCSVLTELPELVGKAWWDWPAALRDRDPDAMAK
jgi:4-alpha-glucanotransferase